MSYCSPVYFLVILPVFVFVYGITPKKHRSKVLILLSYVFFWLISNKLLVFLLVSTFSVHHFGLWLKYLKNEREIKLKEADKDSKKEIKEEFNKKEKRVILLAVLLHIGCLLVLKYTPFFLSNVNSILKLLNLSFRITIPKLLVPIGISFYSLQALSYIIDVHNEKIEADTNLGRLALWMSFFPQIMEGPIVRYSDTAESLWEGRPITYHNLTFGSQRIIWGLLKKMVVADRLNVFIKTIFSDYLKYDGGIIFLAAICYTIQLYCEFSGTMDVILGTGEIFDVKYPENFRQPFFSKSINEFWRRWHITLGTWFKDYIFYPVSLSKPMRKLTTFGRKHLGNHLGPLLAGAVALFCVWLCNGLWHGAQWTFIMFGMYHFVIILVENIIEPYVIKLCEKIHINRQSKPYQLFQMIKTFILIVFGELIFRATRFKAALVMIKRIFTKFSFKGFTVLNLKRLGLPMPDIIITVITLIIILIVGILKEKNINIREKIAEKPIVIRWIIYYLLLFYFLTFGAYGGEYIPIDPIYANFSGGGINAKI